MKHQRVNGDEGGNGDSDSQRQRDYDYASSTGGFAHAAKSELQIPD
jgi:hypothetical protein